MEALLYSFSNRVQNSLSWLTDRAAWDERLSELCLKSAGMLLVNRGALVLAGDCLRMHQRCAAGLHRDGYVANLLFQGTHPSGFESPCLRRLLLGPVISVVEVFPLILVMRTPSVETCFADDSRVEGLTKPQSSCGQSDGSLDLNKSFSAGWE